MSTLINRPHWFVVTFSPTRHYWSVRWVRHQPSGRLCGMSAASRRHGIVVALDRWECHPAVTPPC